VILVDSNVLLDLVTDDPVWADWSTRQLRAAATDELAVNEIVFAELSVRYTSIDGVEDLLQTVRVRLVRTPAPALFLALCARARSGRSPGSAIGRRRRTR
jgi:hypothetical protein